MTGKISGIALFRYSCEWTGEAQTETLVKSEVASQPDSILGKTVTLRMCSNQQNNFQEWKGTIASDYVGTTGTKWDYPGQPRTHECPEYSFY